MNLSYWEHKTWLSNIDFTIVGSGIVGLNCALHLRNLYPSAKILILEKGVLPQGASTKNAGFACFGSISEILADFKNHSEEEVLRLVQRRLEGIQLLRSSLGDDKLGFQQLGGYEVFLAEQAEQHEYCRENLSKINYLLRKVFTKDTFKEVPNNFNFKKVCKSYIVNSEEGQIDTGKMMASLLLKAQKNGIIVLNAVSVEDYETLSDGVHLKTDHFELVTNKLFIATNGFASQLVNEIVKPARAQVLITHPINKLSVKGSFHLDEGYYYFRNIENRILLGGGRNLDFEGEETTDFGQTTKVQNKLENLLSEVILPGTSYEIDRRWSGIMGVGKKKEPIVKQLTDHVYCGVRLGGMGIAIGSFVGKELAELLSV